MGQNLSLRRPRISLTWVLREQQQQSNSNETTGDKSNVDNKKVKSKAKDEKLFNEKFVGNHNLQEYQEKREPSKELLFVCTPQKHNQFATEDRRISKLRYTTVQQRKSENIDELKSLKGTYSEPSLIAASEGNQRRHRHRKRRDRNRVQKFGYEIRNVDEFLSKCSLSSPGNIPVVLSSSSTLYQTRPGGYQIEIPLPLGMVVNAVFKNQNWLYVQTPHAEEGYVGYASCLPLGILPPAIRTTPTSRPTPCWENTGDVFPRPCGNMTDSEKEIRLRGGTRSEGARTPRLRKTPVKTYGEHHVDKLYLRAASQPRLAEKSFAQLKPTQTYTSTKCNNDEYVVLQHRARIAQQQTANGGSKCRSLRQTLVAITDDYCNGSIVVQKGEIVTLLECRETKDRKQWFYVKKNEGQKGFIPAEVAGHGFL
ncbi:unnamed protein product [Hermetia illucens]|uniref:SH3 domain-containing protein n=2 Tax=Hermetia illucens TaxID=343691 RepID=A0A7R8UHQ4_HERIL|nr:unnamed protein product [Hermetia illucens]